MTIKANNDTHYSVAKVLVYEQDYFTNRKYSFKKQLIERHVVEVLRWATKNLNEDLMDGKGKRALDIGCAYGYTSKILCELGYETYSIDISEWGIKQAKNFIRSQFLLSDAQKALPFDAGTFDLVTCYDVLEHLHQPEQALSEMFAVCRGTLVCTTPNKRVEKATRKIMRDYDITHINVKTPEAWKDCVVNNLSFKNFKIESYYDLAVSLRGKLFFKSFNVPKYGLTVRIAIRK